MCVTYVVLSLSAESRFVLAGNKMGQKIDKLTKQPNSFSHTLLQNKKLENSNLYVSRIIFTFINLVLLDFP